MSRIERIYSSVASQGGNYQSLKEMIDIFAVEGRNPRLKAKEGTIRVWKKRDVQHA
jgi:hypothetical protein